MATTTRVRDRSFSTPSTHCASISSVMGKRYPRTLSRISASLRQRTDIARSLTRSGRSDATRPSRICGVSDACLLRAFRSRCTRMLPAEASHQPPHRCLRSNRSLCATLPADEPMLLVRAAEEACNRLHYHVDIVERHIRIERQRYRGIPDLFGNREIASAVAVALAKVGHQMNGTIVHNRADTFSMQMRK